MFTIAFALHAALGDDLRDITVDQNKLCGHLLWCFTNNRLTPFPITSSTVPRACGASKKSFISHSIATVDIQNLTMTYFCVNRVIVGFTTSVYNLTVVTVAIGTVCIKRNADLTRNSSVAHDETSDNEWYLGRDYMEGKLNCVDRN